MTVATTHAFNYMTPAGGVRFFSIIRTAGRWGERVVSHDATFRVLTRLRVWFWQKLSPLSTGTLAGFRQADLLNRLVADIDAMDHVYLRLITPIGAALLSTAGLVFFLSFFDSRLALTLGAILLFGMIALPSEEKLFDQIADMVGAAGPRGQPVGTEMERVVGGIGVKIGHVAITLG